jgi:hypothetical protein
MTMKRLLVWIWTCHQNRWCSYVLTRIMTLGSSESNIPKIMFLCVTARPSPRCRRHCRWWPMSGASKEGGAEGTATEGAQFYCSHEWMSAIGNKESGGSRVQNLVKRSTMTSIEQTMSPPKTTSITDTEGVGCEKIHAASNLDPGLRLYLQFVGSPGQAHKDQWRLHQWWMDDMRPEIVFSIGEEHPMILRDTN